MRGLTRAERRAVAEVRRVGAVPSGCSPEIAPAPARPVVTHVERRVVLTERGSVVRAETVQGQHPARVETELDRIERASAARRRAAGPVFTPRQHAAAALWVTVMEAVEAGGVKLVSLEGGGGGAGSAPRGVSEAVLDMVRRARRMRAAAAASADRGLALCPEGARAVAGRRRIAVLTVLDRVLLGGVSLSRVLEGHGWQPQGCYRDRVREALCRALDAVAEM